MTLSEETERNGEHKLRSVAFIAASYATLFYRVIWDLVPGACLFRVCQVRKFQPRPAGATSGPMKRFFSLVMLPTSGGYTMSARFSPASSRPSVLPSRSEKKYKSEGFLLFTVKM